MIARNLLRYAEAMALQLPLPFPRRLRMLRSSRPTTRAGRAARAARAAVRKALLTVKVRYPAPMMPLARVTRFWPACAVPGTWFWVQPALV